MASPPSVRHLRDEERQSAGAASAPPRQPRALQASTVAVVGLGYVGLPLAVEFGKRYPTVGFDIKTDRVAELKAAQTHVRAVLEVEIARIAARQIVLVQDRILCVRVGRRRSEPRGFRPLRK